MKRLQGQFRAYVSIIGILPFIAAYSPPARADDAVAGASPTPSSSAPGAPSGPDPAVGLSVAGFLVYPSLFIGAIYNDNLYPTVSGRTAALGIAFVPQITAIDDEGMHKTTLSLSADAEIYPDHLRASPEGGSSPTQVSGSANVLHEWTPTQDLTVDVAAGFNRQYGLFGSVLPAGTNFVSAANWATVVTYPQFSNQFSGSVSVEKKFTEQWFLRGGVGAQATDYETVPVNVRGGLSGADYNGYLRSGFWLTPQVNAFVEGGADLRRYRDAWYNANAYRVIGGLGASQLGLLGGEIYAGWQQQVSADGNFGAVAAPSFGGRITYDPTPYLTLAAGLEQSFGSAAAPAASAARSPKTQTLQARFQADYRLAEYWSAFLRAGYGRTSWSNDPLIESEWTLGGGVSYAFWRNLSLTLNYQYTATAANRPNVAVYNQNLVSAGVTYSY